MISARQIGARTLMFNFNCSLGLGFGDGLGLWLSTGHLLLSGLGGIVLLWSEGQKSKVT